MDNLIIDTHPWLFPVFFAVMWFLVTSLLGAFSDWFTLMRAFPDSAQEEWVELKGQSGSMGGVNMNRILNISIGRTGLRFGIMRIFGPFCRDFLVPWEQLRVERKGGLLGKTATLRFGEPQVGWLRIPAHMADSLARASQGNWPEAGSFPEEPSSEILVSVLREWFIGTVLASSFFVLAPRYMAPNAQDAWPVAASILFPAVVLGIAAVFRYRARIKRGK